MVFPPPETVAVYGTLKQGGRNHRLLADSQFLGSDRMANLALYHLGSYPGAVRHPGATLRVEIYRVTPQTLDLLDQLEDYVPSQRRQSLYVRVRAQTRFGPSWLYLYNRTVSGKPRLADGNWITGRHEVALPRPRPLLS